MREILLTTSYSGLTTEFAFCRYFTKSLNQRELKPKLQVEQVFFSLSVHSLLIFLIFFFFVKIALNTWKHFEFFLNNLFLLSPFTNALGFEMLKCKATSATIPVTNFESIQSNFGLAAVDKSTAVNEMQCAGSVQAVCI